MWGKKVKGHFNIRVCTNSPKINKKNVIFYKRRECKRKVHSVFIGATKFIAVTDPGSPKKTAGDVRTAQHKKAQTQEIRFSFFSEAEAHNCAR